MKTLLTESDLKQGVAQLAAAINRDYADRSLTVVGVLTGSLVLLADLIRHIDVPLRVGLVQASSYRGTATRPSDLSINDDLLPDLTGRDVLLIDDIFDTGHTLATLIGQLEQQQVASVRSAVLLRKQGRQEVTLEPDYVAFEIPDQFVVGYGLDYNDLYRNLPFVAALDEELLPEHAAKDASP